MPCKCLFYLEQCRNDEIKSVGGSRLHRSKRSDFKLSVTAASRWCDWRAEHIKRKMLESSL